MTTLSEPVHGETWAFDFVTREPHPDAPRVLAVLLHGVGGDETQLAAIGARLPGDTLVAMPRGQRSISGDRIGWFREALGEDGARIVEDEAEEARGKLVDFIGHLQQRFDVPPARTVLVGYSQGGILAASAALTCPAAVAGFALVCGRIPPEIEPQVRPGGDHARLHALVVHGRQDDTLEPDWAHRACAWLDALRIAHACRLHEAGHALTAAMEDDVVDWFAAPDRPWNRRPG
jgi:phospholipase/carboxylesterase